MELPLYIVDAFTFLEPGRTVVSFDTRSGPLTVERHEALLSMDFPSRPGAAQACPPALREGLGLEPLVVYLARDYLVLVGSEEEVRQCTPRHELLQDLPSLGIIVSAPGRECDFVSRVFFPTDSIMEDPVTGSAHCTLIPYWSNRLGRTHLHARQVSTRGGELFCENRGGSRPDIRRCSPEFCRKDLSALTGTLRPRRLQSPAGAVRSL